MIDFDHKDNDWKLFFIGFSKLWSQYATFGGSNKMFDCGGLKNLDFEELGRVRWEGWVLFFHLDGNI